MEIDPEQIMVYIILAIGLTILAYAYWTSNNKFKHLILSFTMLFLLIISLFYIYQPLQIFVFMGILVLLVYIVLVNLYPVFFSSEYKRLLIDKKKTVWELLPNKPQSKTQGGK
jgi:uncharacterized membrane protein